MGNCGCGLIDSRYIEEWIPDSDIIIEVPAITREINNTNLLDLKKKVIYEYYSVLDSLECGILTNLQTILEEISLIWIIQNTI